MASKKLKKLVSAALALAIVSQIGVTAFAADEEEFCEIPLGNHPLQSDEGKSLSLSDCVDRKLDVATTKLGNNYYDHCCYIRLQKQGSFYSGCIPLKQIDYSDIPQTMKYIEKGTFKGYEDWGSSKVYDLKCKGSFVYISFFALALLGLIL